MMRALLPPGSFLWLVAHDLRLNWRRFVDMLGGTGSMRAILIAAIGAVALHVIAWPSLPFVAEHIAGSATGAESRLAIGALLVCIMSWMTAQGLFAATRTLYDRGDLDLLYGSPLAPRRILAAKATAIALSSLGSVAILALPVANAGALRYGPHWLAAYPALAGLALFATSLALATTLMLFRALGPRRARLYAHMAGAVIGGAFVLGAQVVALLPDDVRNGLVAGLAPGMDGETSLASRILWLPVDAMLADPQSLSILLGFGLAAFFLAAHVLGRSFERASLEAVGSPNEGSATGPRRAVRFRAGPAQALRRKEWRLLVRDPSLFAQLGLQIVYTIPLAVVLVRSGSLPIAVAIAPAIVVIAAQVAASLAWIAVSGEDAPELIASAPVSAGSVDIAKLSAIALPVLGVAAVPAAGLALASVHAAAVAMLFAAGASASTALLNLWHPMPGNRRGMLRRHAQSKFIGLIEHLLAVLWAMATVFALIGSLLCLVPIALACIVLGHGRISGWFGRWRVSGRHVPPVARSIRHG
jgi:ABC-2 type transport system permease protein